jgi:molybdate transport system ATP-binding protein
VDSFATPRPLISLNRLSLQYSGTEILRDVSLDIASGGHVALIGPNGSGKSSLLRILSGELWPARDGGMRSYSLDGTTLIESPLLIKPHVRRIAPEMQERFLRLGLPLSTYEFVASGLADRDYAPVSLSAAEDARVCEVMEQLRLGHVAAQEARRLSHGTLRRAFVARALVASPRILALDEVTDGLDHVSHTEVLEQLDAAVHKGTTLVCVAHRIDRLPHSVQRYCEIRDKSLYEIAVPNTNQRVASSPVRIEPQTTHEDTKAETLIRCEHVGLIIDEKPILHDIYLEIRAGEHVAIVGENGAGKTTLCGILDGTYLPSSGSVVRMGFARRPAIWEIRERIIVLSDALQIRHDWDITVKDTLASGFTGTIGVVGDLDAEQARRLDALLDIFLLRELTARSLPSLSFGQRRRVLFARALARRPQIFILDEIFDGLDPQIRMLLEQELLTLTKSGTALIIVAHVAQDIPDYVTRRIVMKAGRLQEAIPEPRPVKVTVCLGGPDLK